MCSRMLIVCAALWLPTIAHAEMICKYVDKNGNLHYTNTIPQSGWTLQSCGEGGSAEALPKSASPSSEWILFSKTDSAMIYIKPDTIVREGPLGKAWFMYDFFSPKQMTQYHSLKWFGSMKVLEKFNCSLGTVGEAQEVLYKDPLGGGQIMHSAASTPEYLEPAPDSLASQMLQRVCSPRRK
jgi:hypothetical protein